MHYSKVKLHSIFPESSPICEKHELADADLLHSFALCTKLQDFWVDIFDFLSRLFGVQLEPEPVLIILGVSDALRTLSVP